jgi:hypothetical protein
MHGSVSSASRGVIAWNYRLDGLHVLHILLRPDGSRPSPLRRPLAGGLVHAQIGHGYAAATQCTQCCRNLVTFTHSRPERIHAHHRIGAGRRAGCSPPPPLCVGWPCVPAARARIHSAGRIPADTREGFAAARFVAAPVCHTAPAGPLLAAHPILVNLAAALLGGFFALPRPRPPAHSVAHRAAPGLQFPRPGFRSFPTWGIRPAQLDFTVGGLKPISEGHSFHFAGAAYKYLYGGVPYKSPKIAENRRKSELQADLRGSLLLPTTVKSNAPA